jgi:hypothetical protein
MIATVPRPDGGAARLLLELRWCRFIGPGVYESGGRFLRVVTSETNAA